MRKIRGFALLVALLLALSGCAQSPLVQTQTELTDVALPTPLDALAPVAPVKDAHAEESMVVTLVYVSADGQQLLERTRRLWVGEDVGMLEQVVDTLLQPPTNGDIRPVAPGGMRLLSAELVNGIATINLSGEARDQSAQDMAYMRIALTNTIAGLPGVSHVNILINGQAEGIGGESASMPSGAHTYYDGSPQAIWHQMQLDEERFSQSNGPREVDAVAILYFASEANNRLVPEARAMRVESDNLIMPLLSELLRGPQGLTNVRAVFPEGSDPLVAVPTITASLDGRRVINLPIKESFEAELVSRGMPLDQFYGALTLTLTGFVPEVDGIVVRLGGNRIVDSLAIEGDVQTFTNGVMTAGDFGAQVGDVAGIYLSNAEGKLALAGRVLDPYAARQPRTLIDQLIQGPVDGDGGLSAVMPEGVSSADVLGIAVEGGVALINLSSNFYRCAQKLDEQQERLMVYAVVNTLTDLNGIDRVRFYIEGEVEDSLAHDIYLRVELMRNPGFIAP